MFKLRFLILIFFLGVAFLTAYYVNFYYWRADSLAAQVLWQEAALIPSFYQDFFRKDYALFLKQNPGSDEVGAAMEALEESLDNRPRDYFIRLAYADAAIAFGRLKKEFFSKAEARLQEALKISPSRQQAYYVLAKLKVASGDKEGLFGVMDKAIKLDPGSGESHFFYGLFALQLGDEKIGFQELALAKKLRREPKNNQEAKIIAGYYGDSGFYKDAVNYYKLALLYDPQDWESLFKKGLVHYYDKDKDSARETFTELLKKNPQFKGTADFQKIGQILKQLGL